MQNESFSAALTITAAAELTGVDRRAIRRHLDAGLFPHAGRQAGPSGTGRGPWRIPLEDLRDAGLLEGEVVPAKAAAEPRAIGAAHPEVVRLRTELAATRRRAETAESAVTEYRRMLSVQRRVRPERRHLALAVGDEHAGDEHAETVDDAAPVLAAAPPLPTPSTDAAVHPASGADDAASRGPDGRLLAPRFAASWASAPPWEHVPEAAPESRRWWQLLHAR
jgi:hypothetical protein